MNLTQEDVYMLWVVVAGIALFAWCCVAAGHNTSINLRQSDHDATMAAEDQDAA